MANIAISSPELLRFYSEWLNWVDNGAPNLKPFYRGDALCASLWYVPYTYESRRALKKELRAQFADAGLDESFPFGEDAWDEASLHRTMHADVNRIAWVRARIQDAYKA